MKFFSQLDYPKDFLGYSKKFTIAQYGCYLTSLAMIIGYESPPALNAFLTSKNKDCFVGEGETMMNSPLVAEVLGMNYKKISLAKKPKEGIVIAETHDTKAPQHFFVYDCKTGVMADPLSKAKKWEKKKYNIVSLRVFTHKLLEPEKKTIEAKISLLNGLVSQLSADWHDGTKYNSLCEKHAKNLREMRNEWESLLPKN
jgi:hypothetical protein